MSLPRPRTVVWLLLVLALLARLAFVLATPDYLPRVDDRDYLRLGAAIARSGTYPVFHVSVTRRGCPALRGIASSPCLARPGAPGAYTVARPTAYRPPAYPYALAVPELLARLSGGSPLDLARGLQVLLGVLDAALLGLLAATVWGQRVGLVALALGAVYLPLVLVSATLISEPLYVALMLGALTAVLRRRPGRGGVLSLGGAGVLAGLSALTRSNGIVVVIAVAVLAGALDAHAHGLRRLRGAVIVLACSALTIAPWTVRNAIVLGSFVPISTETGGTLVGTYNPASRADRVEPATWLGLSHIPRYSVLYREQAAHPETAIDALLRRDAVDFAAGHPLYLARVAWHNTVRLLDLDGLARVRFGAGTVDLPPGPAVAAALIFLFVAVLAVTGALLPAARGAPRALWLLPALQFISTVLVIAETPRFRTALEPFVLMLAALRLERWGSRLSHRARTRRERLRPSGDAAVADGRAPAQT